MSKALPVLPLYPESLCHRCEAARYVESDKKSVFILCTVLPNKYPRQPVVSCAFYRPRGTLPQ